MVVRLLDSSLLKEVDQLRTPCHLFKGCVSYLKPVLIQIRVSLNQVQVFIYKIVIGNTISRPVRTDELQTKEKCMFV